MATRNRRKNKSEPAARSTQSNTETTSTRNNAEVSHWSSVAIATITLSLLATAGGIWAAYEALSANERESRNDSILTLTEPNVSANSCAQAFKRKEFLLRGNAKLAHGASLWEITRGEDDSLWVGPKAEIDSASPDSSWKIRIPFIGADGDKGHEYTVMVVSATPDAAIRLRSATQPKDNKYEPLEKLPDGVQILAEICVKRAD